MPEVFAQYNYKVEGKCGEDVKWSFDGITLVISNVSKKNLPVNMDDYDISQNIAPWIKKKLSIRKVLIQRGIKNIGSCAFANSRTLQEVIFIGSDLENIGWGAFLNCVHLRNISLPIGLRNIETIAFANCSSLTSVILPDRCRIADQAYASCTNLKMVDIAPTAIIGHLVFANEVNINGKTRHAMYAGELRHIPSYINIGNCQEFGLSKASVDKCTNQQKAEVNYDYATSVIDTIIPVANEARYDIYALIIGNQNYRFAANVPYAIHDARIFADYCKKTLGVPVEQIHVAEDATKQMIMEEELGDWVSNIPYRENKKLIVYYAGHGVPDIKNKNKAYILPTDVRGTNPQRGIALDDFYNKLGELAFAQTSVFIDACFSGVTRNNEGVTEGLRGVEIEAEEATFNDGNIVVFSAAQGNETAQGFPEEGHGLFTYYLLKEMQSTRGFVKFGDLSDRITSNVSRQAGQLKLHKKQTPKTLFSEKLSENWRDLNF
ncbi:MAG: leucine-rich repeat protein [Prevotella sp.]|nr:leucine-rich repeat protein [Prevotella sp.]